MNGTQWKEASVIQKKPQVPTTMAENTVEIEPVETKKVRVVFEHALPTYTGVTEMSIWGPASSN